MQVLFAAIICDGLEGHNFCFGFVFTTLTWNLLQLSYESIKTKEVKQQKEQKQLQDAQKKETPSFFNVSAMYHISPNDFYLLLFVAVVCLPNKEEHKKI